MIVSDRKYNRGAQRRLEFIEFRLAWEGSIQRADLVDFFKISVQQASKDLNRYQVVAPTNLEYDFSKKSYVVGKQFNPVFIPRDSDSYLSPLLSVGIGLRSKDETFIGWLPDLGSIPSFKRWVDPHILFELLSAMRNKRDVFVKYHSITRGEIMTRWLAPHALGFDGLRWHVRAYCHLRNRFRDFVLVRIADVIEQRAGSIDPKQDAVWNRFVQVKIGSHPRLKEGQRKIIELDYGMSDGQKNIQIRGALLFYLLRRLGIEKEDNSLDDNPDVNQIVLLNRNEIDEVLKENEAETP
ncbi:MAG: WYL domain-containing protein [Sulfuricaulis sp.]